MCESQVLVVLHDWIMNCCLSVWDASLYNVGMYVYIMQLVIEILATI